MLILDTSLQQKLHLQRQQDQVPQTTTMQGEVDTTYLNQIIVVDVQIKYFHIKINLKT